MASYETKVYFIPNKNIFNTVMPINPSQEHDPTVTKVKHIINDA
jgi:hypothetical protein